MINSSPNLEDDREIANNTTFYNEEYRLPDGSLVRIGKERFEASEVLFEPYIGGYELQGLGEMVFDSIRVFLLLKIARR